MGSDQTRVTSIHLREELRMIGVSSHAKAHAANQDNPKIK